LPRTLIVFATRHGQVAKIARFLADCLTQDGAEVDVINAADRRVLDAVDIAQYQRVVLGVSMHAGGLEKELVTWANQHQLEIEALPHFLFVVTLSAATPDKQLRQQSLADVTQKVQQQLALDFPTVEMIAGALTYSKYRWPVKWLMQRIARKAGEDTDTRQDYEYTDWQQVREFAKRILAG
jgi:menaquinone-dependent protoporphyrinogen oxidase